MNHTKQALRAGLLGGAAMEAWGVLTHRAGLAKLSLSRYEGSLLTGRTHGLGSRAAGMGAHVLLSALIAVPYAHLMRRSRRAGPTVGVTLGVLHWLTASLVLPGLDALNPTVREGRTPPLRRFAAGYGPGTTLMFLLGHLLYGAVVGAVYDPDGRT